MGAKLTQDTFNLVKGLIKAEKADQIIADLLGISRSTVNRIERSESFEEYKQIQMAYKAASAANRAKEEEKIEQIEIPAIKPNDDDPCGLLRELTEILTMMHSKLELIVDMLR